MRTLVTLLLLTLVSFLSYSSAVPVAPGLGMEGGCCPHYTKDYIPKGMMRHVAMTLSHCKPAAIVVKTVCNKTFCLDPNWTWAKNLLNEFKKSTANNSPPSAPFNVKRCPDVKKV